MANDNNADQKILRAIASLDFSVGGSHKNALRERLIDEFAKVQNNSDLSDDELHMVAGGISTVSDEERQLTGKRT